MISNLFLKFSLSGTPNYVMPESLSRSRTHERLQDSEKSSQNPKKRPALLNPADNARESNAGSESGRHPALGYSPVASFWMAILSRV